ncbi:uncharacterized protein FIBRA_02868 [Fibroporia radiculosa]|uniref:F-box domain-containing protein n=1 Tax=Fibroporia radiculosa TaxID=599839 RepID=J4I9A6_9APHY|nr:uncharacterized protein FIBRA_02868 [Fibroporia radiculosa]CCM00826.1 predicted protein [Fibroporia radiculosa]
MVQFLDLPLELLPLIVQHFVRPSHFAALCLVNKYFYTFAISLLYERAFIYAWHKEGKAKVVKLFKTLSECSHLAQHLPNVSISKNGCAPFVHWTLQTVKPLDFFYAQIARRRNYVLLTRSGVAVIRDFPKALQSSDYDNVLSICLQGIQNCVNLRSCTWTRDGSLTTEILEALLHCSHLEELEINGRYEGHYDPITLLGFTHLRRLSLIMPSARVIEMLPAWISVTGASLRHLSLICKSSTLVHDGVLESLAPHLVNLEHLYLVNCQKVTDRGLYTILSGTTHGLFSLGMEGLSPEFDMARFSQDCVRSGALSHLGSITLTVNVQSSPTWEKDVLALLASAPLERFHISTVGGHVGPALSESFCTSIVNAHGHRLRRFSVHRIRMSMLSIDDICRRCVELEQLFIVVEQNSLDSLGSCLAQARKLCAVHVNRPLDLGSEDIPVMARERILSIVKQCGPNLKQFGYNTRVLQVERVVKYEEDGSLGIDVRLGAYENPEIPEQFLVVRT